MKNRFKSSSWLAIGLALVAIWRAEPLHAADALPEPGPENKGMRLRFTVKPEGAGTNEGYRVRLELINTTDQPVPLAADWGNDGQKGDFKEWLEAACSIETDPAIMPPMAQYLVSLRTLPQPEFTLAPKEILAVEWVSIGRKLKNTISKPGYNSNPTFPTVGLYAVHASLSICSASNAAARAKNLPTRTPDGRGIILARGRPLPDELSEAQPHGEILLRSNEQLVPIGGSRELPRHTFGKVAWVNTNQNKAMIDLGLQQKIEVGDRFRVYTGRIGYWDLKITKLSLTTAEESLQPINEQDPLSATKYMPPVEPGQFAELILPTDPRFKTLPDSVARE